MERKQIESSNMNSIGHNAKKQLLEVEFHNGKVYQYHPVSKETYEELINAKSIGSWFWENIRNNKSIKFKDIS